MRVLVTGGAGYIGSHTCKQLAARGMVPVTVDNMAYGHEWAVKWGPLYKLDIQNVEGLTDVLKKEKIDAVLHFAAHTSVGESHHQPLKYYQNNVIGSMRVLEAMRNAGISKLVFSSTCATYGIPDRIPMTEEMDQNPINPYGGSKLMAERVLKDFVEPYQLSVVALRYFNASGADPELEIGEDHSPETHLIPLALDAAYGRRNQLTIFGEDYPTPDGTCIRDYVHVNDLAEAHILALDRLNKPQFEAYNLGTGSGASVKQIISKIEDVTGCRVPVQHGQRRAGDPPILVASGARARERLKWEPRQSTLENIVTTAANWHRTHFKKR